MREEAWARLAEAGDAVSEAWEALLDEPSAVMTRARAETAMREYVERLAPIVGTETAFRCEASFEACIDAMDRIARLRSSLSVHSPLDASDIKFLASYEEALNAAGRQFDQTESAIEAELLAAAARDGVDEEGKA